MLPVPARTSITIAIAFFSLIGIAARTGTGAKRAPVPTFNKEIIRIFQEKCQGCHRPGDIAPFSLLTYKDAQPRASAIHEATSTGEMPPWKPAAGCGEFEGERRLTSKEIELIARWATGGAPEGSPDDLPPARDLSGDWPEGKPDLIVAMAESYTPPADRDMYRCFSIPTESKVDLAVRMVDTLPGNRGIVHHMIAVVDTTGESAALDEADPGPGYTCFGGAGFNSSGGLSGWAPGSRPSPLPDGTAIRVPAGSRIVMQVHYHPHHGHGGSDKTALGLYLAKSPVARWLQFLTLKNSSFIIPAGAKNHRVEAAATIPVGVVASVWNVTPHMHLLGRTMRVDATLPDGTTACLVNIDDWDFNWQGTYVYRKPVILPGGTKLKLVATYDNSADNPKNPQSPPRDATWGNETTDEMCFTTLGVTYGAVK
jgi:mono/diheme cytochrome c family protein